jgi:K319-like protein/PKD domain-containing protein/HYR domain-containing protein
LFPAGTNTVNCMATDSSGNSASCSFLIVVDLPPVVNAGIAQAITLPITSATLHGTVSDDGLVGPLSMIWTKLSGPGTVAFGNAAAASTTATFSTNGTYVLQLTASDGLVSTSDHVTIVVDSPPKITQSPTAIGGLELGDGTLIVPTEEATIFTIGTSDADGTPTSLWNFGDGTLSTNNTPAYTFTNCGPRQVTVTVSDGISSTSQVMMVQPACQMIMTAEKIQVNFSMLKRLDTFSSRGILNLPTNMVTTGVSVAVQVGSVQQVFTLNKRGRGRNSSGNITLAYSKRRGWTYNVRFKGIYASEWAANGLSNGTVKNVPVHVPVFFVFDTNPLFAYMSDNVLQYTATRNKQGTAKK